MDEKDHGRENIYILPIQKLDEFSWFLFFFFSKPAPWSVTLSIVFPYHFMSITHYR